MKPQVLYIVTKLELGGAQKVCLSLFKGIKDSGGSSFLISGAEGSLAKDIQNNSNIILLKNFKREISFSYFFMEFKNIYNLIKHIKRIKKSHPNLIVHTHSTKAGIIGRWAAFFANVKVRIHTVHGYGFHSYQSRPSWVFRYLCELITSFVTTHYICVSSSDVATGKRLFPRFAKKHSIIRAAVDWKQFFIPAQTLIQFPQNKEFVFGTISCLKKQKNLFDLLKAFEWTHNNNKNTRLEIIGDGAMRPQLEQWIKNHKLESSITLHGWKDTVAPFMLSWHAFILSSLWEGLPCSVIEARLLKLPVLSYNTGGISDVIHQGKNGFLYKQQDWNSLAKGMLNLTQQPTLHTNLQSYQEDLTDFNDSVMIEKHTQLYQSFFL